MMENWCFQSVVLEKTLESPLDCKEIQPAHPKGDQPWVFIGRTDVKAETPIVWSPCHPRDSQGSSPRRLFKSINSSALSFLYGPALTSIHDYWKNHNFVWTFVSKVMFLPFNILSRFVKGFLPKSKCLLISWLQSPSAVILEPKKIVCYCFHCFFIYLPWSDGTGRHDLSFLNFDLICRKTFCILNFSN